VGFVFSLAIDFLCSISENHHHHWHLRGRDLEDPVAEETSDKVQKQVKKLQLPTGGKVAFVAKLIKNRRGQLEIERAAVLHGPRKGKIGYVDVQGRIWLKDYAHAGYPDHWDVQLDAGKDYMRVGFDGEPLP